MMMLYRITDLCQQQMEHVQTCLLLCVAYLPLLTPDMFNTLEHIKPTIRIMCVQRHPFSTRKHSKIWQAVTLKSYPKWRESGDTSDLRHRLCD